MSLMHMFVQYIGHQMTDTGVVPYNSSLQWVFGRNVFMEEPSTLDVFIKIKHHFIKINLQSPTGSYQLITFANNR